MLKKVAIAAVAVSVALLNGCASMNQDECLNASWQLIGFEDALAGRTMARIGDHRKACAKYNIVPEQEQYQRGFDEGLVSFCTPANAYEVGRRGRSYHNQCPGQLNTTFLEYYNQGKHRRSLSNAIKGYTSSIDRNLKKIEDLEKDIARKEARVISDESNIEERVRLINEIKQHKEEIGTLRANIRESERLRGVKQNELSQLKKPEF